MTRRRVDPWCSAISPYSRSQLAHKTTFAYVDNVIRAKMLSLQLLDSYRQRRRASREFSTVGCR